MSLLSINRLTVQYKNSSPVIQNFSLDLLPSDILALVGGNGTGKSTIVGVLAGLIPSFSGEIRFTGLPWNKNALRCSAFVFDHPYFPPLMNAHQILRYFAHEYGQSCKEAGGILELCGLSSSEKTFRHYSRGMRQALALAAALLKQPRLLVIDEGFSALDTATKNRIFGHLKHKSTVEGLSILFTTHSNEDCEQLASRTVRLTSAS